MAIEFPCNLWPLPVNQTKEEEEQEAVGTHTLAAHVAVRERLQTDTMNKLDKPQEFDSYEIEEPSDEERAESRWETNANS